MKKSEYVSITGGLSNPSKMPGKAYSLPAAECITGSKLRKVPGSVCSKCYACKGRYAFGNVQRALYRRLAAVRAAIADGPGSLAWNRWLCAMRALIGSDAHFRFHDSGDIQSELHLELYAELAENMPQTQFWIPTKETQIVKRARVKIPANLTVRLSGSMVNGPAPSGDFPTSVVWDSAKISAEKLPAGYHVCPSSLQGNVCGDCRACWDPTVATVVYRKH